ncbi:MAG TPA: hypothetical protein VD905_17720 [Flavobacteriales bacterium]|nr:hypothetical protein [Flavobacteriales bacterium]
MLKEIEERISGDYKKLVSKVKTGRSKLKVELAKNKKAAIKLKDNAQDALSDLKSGKVFTDDDAAKNLKNTLTDTLKAVGMTGIFILPGGSIGLIALRKMLRSKEAKALGIENLLTLTIEEAKKLEDEEEKKLPGTDGNEKPVKKPENE